jgi:hypothetical protein
MQPHQKFEHWKGIIEDWQGSGQTQREYCAGRGLGYSLFCYWNHKVKAESDGEASPHRVHAVEVRPLPVSPFSTSLWPVTTLELDTQGIVLAIPGSDATVTIVGRVSLGALGRIMAACEGVGDHAQA